jgi:hypothetical protein
MSQYACHFGLLTQKLCVSMQAKADQFAATFNAALLLHSNMHATEAQYACIAVCVCVSCRPRQSSLQPPSMQP